MAHSNTTDVPCVAVAGSGYWGKNLVRNFDRFGALRLICDKSETLVSHFKKQYPHVDVCLAFTDVLSREEIDGVAIATPAETHFTLAREALLAGKHVFVEKPLALTQEEGAHLVELADKQALILMVGHILHYHPAVIRLKQLVSSGELGKIQYLYSNRLNIGRIRAEENILWSFAPHDISVILGLLGEMPEAVWASGGSYLQHKIPDTTLTTLDFPSGVKAHIFVSWLHPFKEQKLVVVGNEKMAVFDDVSREKLLLFPHKIHWLERIPVASRAEAEIVPVKTDEPLRAECGHFLHCVRSGERPHTDGHEGLRVLRVLRASQRSLNRNGCRISLDPTPETERWFTGEKLTGVGGAGRNYFVHESAYVDDGVHIGEETRIWHFSHLLSGSSIGRKCNIGQNVVVGPDAIIGNGCKIQNNVSVYRGVTLEDDVFCGPSMVFTNVFNPRAGIPRMDRLRPTLVRKGATIGANATILCGVTLGQYSFVGASAVVTKDVPDFALVVGNPAKRIGWVCACGERLPEHLVCLACGKTYKKTERGLFARNDDSKPTSIS